MSKENERRLAPEKDELGHPVIQGSKLDLPGRPGGDVRTIRVERRGWRNYVRNEYNAPNAALLAAQLRLDGALNPNDPDTVAEFLRRGGNDLLKANGERTFEDVLAEVGNAKPVGGLDVVGLLLAV